ncbi:MAG: hypothetical protein AAGA76_00460 [Pseudomonadota bacterium]
MATEKYPDDLLTAYLDGEVSPETAKEIKVACENNLALQQRLDALDIPKEQMVAAVDQLLDIAPKMPDLPLDLKTETESRMSSWAGNLRAVAAGLVMLVAGGAGGFYLNQQPADGWRDYVAAYHLLYVNSTLSNVETNASVQVSELDRISEAIAKPVSLETVTQVEGLDYKRAQILGFEGKPLAQMTFLSKMGTPIALCIIRTGATDAKLVEMEELEGMASASWTRDGYAYLLIGGKDQQLINDAARKFSKIL